MLFVGLLTCSIVTVPATLSRLTRFGRLTLYEETMGGYCEIRVKDVITLRSNTQRFLALLKAATGLYRGYVRTNGVIYLEKGRVSETKFTGKSESR